LAESTTRLRRSRLAGALVALGMWFYSESLRSSYSELLFTFDLSDLTRCCGRISRRIARWTDLRPMLPHRGGKIKWRMENDNLFFAETNFELDVVHRNL
jgi:hypothetical protein